MKIPFRFQAVTLGAFHTAFLGTPVRTVFAGTVLFAGLVIVLRGFGVSDVWCASLPTATLVIVSAAILYDRNEKHYRQIEAMVRLANALNLKAPLPPLRAWRLAPDAGAILVQWLRRKPPQNVVEIGCGVSTILTASILKEQGSGTVYALEHDADQAMRCRQQLELMNLDGHAKVIHAPLVDHFIDGKHWRWYDLAEWSDAIDIDLLLVDGPPVWTQPAARYPALPLLYDRFTPDCVVLMDDANRRSERAVLARWKREFSQWTWKDELTEDGLLVGTQGVVQQGLRS
ncbi:class I SAM-dependent methyltransferase [Roseimaritima ulvae]|uniref:Class I SAM-dependent methyltransferase n=1 Tax=Roseimaritima ulvae TaxID=980254 RepID=A0A5B9QSJ1_9BACT|nr:class I SAM-dependent methyltransferase [Roseimaritima ulvae]QEG40862.1 hypothetical protein UC8_28800 [Roseimaritima ulvae]